MMSKTIKFKISTGEVNAKAQKAFLLRLAISIGNKFCCLCVELNLFARNGNRLLKNTHTRALEEGCSCEWNNGADK
jgi:hypothetical protein